MSSGPQCSGFRAAVGQGRCSISLGSPQQLAHFHLGAAATPPSSLSGWARFTTIMTERACAGVNRSALVRGLESIVPPFRCLTPTAWLGHHAGKTARGDRANRDPGRRDLAANSSAQPPLMFPDHALANAFISEWVESVEYHRDSRVSLYRERPESGFAASETRLQRRASSSSVSPATNG